MGLEMKEIELKAHLNQGKGKSRLGGGELLAPSVRAEDARHGTACHLVLSAEQCGMPP